MGLFRGWLVVYIYIRKAGGGDGLFSDGNLRLKNLGQDTVAETFWCLQDFHIVKLLNMKI